ncbi:Acetyltransferase (GNAT) family protein [Micromonospora purpureochromogenes]|uniref:Acetyltransferase (GNAT) family protein n=1 Tax=Micromonospora purpureochromogenes TaxID=47872 RepID=A0A1C4ZJS9_9ACTN|nr:GNAT family N-acetyltransferase [Micromonospora purpureochromogenes]SCF33182.1 Acetyltransferase (GNAT) family protein [Micromonospora purpureochromogenes]
MSRVTAGGVDVLRAEDVRTAAALHVRAFERFFLTSLGEPFLREFYAGFVRDPDAVTVVTRDPDGRLVGVVVGTVAPELFFRRLLRQRGPRLALASLPAVVRRPAVALRLLRGVAYRGEVPVETHGALLSSICVDPAVAHGGHGRRLLDAWWEAVRLRGVSSAHLTTDADDNERVNAFYRRAGWTLRGTWTTQEGRRMNCYGIAAAPVGAEAGHPAG